MLFSSTSALCHSSIASNCPSMSLFTSSMFFLIFAIVSYIVFYVILGYSFDILIHAYHSFIFHAFCAVIKFVMIFVRVDFISLSVAISFIIFCDIPLFSVSWIDVCTKVFTSNYYYKLFTSCALSLNTPFIISSSAPFLHCK